MCQVAEVRQDQALREGSGTPTLKCFVDCNSILATLLELNCAVNCNTSQVDKSRQIHGSSGIRARFGDASSPHCSSIESQCTQCIASLELASSQSPQIASLVGRVDCLFPVVRALKWDQGGQASIADPVAPQHWEYFIICKYYLQITVCHWCSKPSENFKQLPWSYWSLGSWQRPLRISSERKEVKAGSQVSRALANEK